MKILAWGSVERTTVELHAADAFRYRIDIQNLAAGGADEQVEIR